VLTERGTKGVKQKGGANSEGGEKRNGSDGRTVARRWAHKNLGRSMLGCFTRGKTNESMFEMRGECGEKKSGDRRSEKNLGPPPNGKGRHQMMGGEQQGGDWGAKIIRRDEIRGRIGMQRTLRGGKIRETGDEKSFKGAKRGEREAAELNETLVGSEKSTAIGA